MKHISLPRLLACLRAALTGEVRPALMVLLLAMAVRLFARGETAWLLSPDDDYDDEYEETYAPILFVMGRAPHAAVMEAGLVPDWIFSSRNRGMRPKSARRPARLQPKQARAPPHLRRKTPSDGNGRLPPYLLRYRNFTHGGRRRIPPA